MREAFHDLSLEAAADANETIAALQRCRAHAGGRRRVLHAEVKALGVADQNSVVAQAVGDGYR